MEKRDSTCDDAVVVEITRIARELAGRNHTRDDADDLAQDVALKCLIKLREGKLEINPDSLPGLVRQMVQQRTRDRRRREKRARNREAEFAREVEASSHDWMKPDAPDEARELAEFWERALAMLPPRCRQIYVLVREDGLSHDAAARQLGIAPSTVEWHLWEANRRLRRAFEDPARGGITDAHLRSS